MIVITGPTASGKTALAIELAQKHNAEIFSADSRQFYREMSIGTAKPDTSELKAAVHHFINHLSLHDQYSAGDFERDCMDALNLYFTNKKLAILVGGSGLYIDAICNGVDEFPAIDPKYRVELNQELKTKGLEALVDELKEKDFSYYENVDLQNPHRVIRALEVCRATGQSFSSFLNQKKTKRSFGISKFAIDIDRPKLYDRINHRVDIMFDQGLVEEARKLYPMKEINALQTVGYRELFEYFDGNCTIETARENIKKNTRRYAKRQMTWLRKDASIIWLSEDPEQQLRIIEKNLAFK